MRNIATCYSEHAVRVSDSYCSGPLNKSYVSPKSIPSSQNVVTSTYKSYISTQNNCLFITIIWCNKLICQGFYLKISEKRPNPSKSLHGFHQMNKIKGHKLISLDSDDKTKVDVRWDLSDACFEEAGPQPSGGFYIVMLVGAQFGLIVGDMEDNDHMVRDFVVGLEKPKLALVSQCEHFIGNWKNSISSRARFCDHGSEHEIMIKCWPEDDGPHNPVLSVYIDMKRVVKIKKLQWNFRGNQVIFVDGLLVDVMWDVCGWYSYQTVNSVGNSDNNKSGCGLFMFRTRSGLDSRLWLEEQEKKLSDKFHDKPEFSLLICASSKNPD